MAGGVIYLDIDDEITSAAARIRAVDGRRAAIVLPLGSRVATSRINFRLLSRDALTHEKGLSIIAGDAATRALAASAGLPVFSSVGEYEASLGPRARADVPAADTPEPADLASGAADLAGETARVPVAPTSDEPAPGPPVQQTLDDMEAAELAAAAAAIRTPVAPATRTSRPVAATSGTSIRDVPRGTSPRDARIQDVPVRAGPEGQGIGRRIPRTPLLVGLGAIALVVLIAGVGAYLVLPSATIVVTPRNESVGPLTMTIVADPTATAPDTDAKVIPADVISIDATATDTFPATGKRVEETKATGSVQFENLDPTSANTIASGSVVRTSGGLRFVTNAAVTVARADLVPSDGGFAVIPKYATVGITAVELGPASNVGADRITQVPRNENGQFLKVTNPEATSGGKRDEFPRVAQKDVDAALAALEPALQADFVARLSDPSIAPPGATVFPATGVLGVPVPTVDPAKLVDQEVATFDLGLSATGTVTAVDPAPAKVIAADRLRATIDAGHRLVDGSIEVTVDPAVVSGDQISFPTSVTATQVAILDPAELKAQVMGRPLAEARSILESYGTVRLTAWPDWVSTIPTLDGRVELTLDEAVPVESSEPTAAP